MNAIEYLSRPNALRKAIRAREEKAEALRAMALRCTACYAPDPSETYNPRPFENPIIQAADLSRECVALRRLLQEAAVDLAGRLSALEDPQQIALLSARYLEGKTMAALSRDFHLDLRHLRRLLRAAEAAFAEQLETCPPSPPLSPAPGPLAESETCGTMNS